MAVDEKKPGFKKIEMARKLRLAALSLSLALAVLSGLGMAWVRRQPEEKKETYIVYPYLQTAEIDYRVHLLPNPLIKESAVGPGKAYITDLTDYIDVGLHYSFQGDSDAGVKAEYSSTAVLTAKSREDLVVWEREEELLALKEFTAQGSQAYFRDTVAVPFAKYLKDIEDLRKETGYAPEVVDLSVRFHVKVTVTAGGNTAVEVLSPELTVPMGGSTYTVAGNLSVNGGNGIAAERIVSDSRVLVARQASLVINLAAALSLIFFAFATVSPKQVDNQQQLELRQILKKHGSRIIKASGEPASLKDKILTVAAFNELLKAADELGRPIVFQQVKTGRGSSNKFFVFSPEIVYLYSLDVVHQQRKTGKTWSREA
ncbi:MAG TPA: DUF5305 domain-containing protein [Firmicutes bacterium]|nr:DUF5305 domain-containing protein [Bacillota bacterium]